MALNKQEVHDLAEEKLEPGSRLDSTSGRATPVEENSDLEDKVPSKVAQSDTTSKLVLHRVDGGLKAWSVVAGAFFALFVQFGLGEPHTYIHLSPFLLTLMPCREQLWNVSAICNA